MSIKSFFAKAATKVALNAKVAAPHIFVGVGIIGMAGAGVLACVQTAKHFEEIVDFHNENMDKIRQAKDLQNEGEGSEITEEEVKSATAGVYFQTFYKGLKVYALPIGIAALSAFSIIYGHGLLNKRYVSAAAGLAAMKETYDAARKRAKDRFGEDIEKSIFDDARKELVTKQVVDEETGEVKEQTVEEYAAMSKDILSHPFTFFFGADTAPHVWSRHPGYNLSYLIDKQNEFNDKLKFKGAVTMNEVLAGVGMDIVDEGLTNGWTRGDVIDFGILQYLSADNDPGCFSGGLPDYILKLNCHDISGVLKSAKETAKKPRKKAWLR